MPGPLVVAAVRHSTGSYTAALYMLSTVTLHEEGAADSTSMVVDPAEFEDGETQVSADSPVGLALLGRAPYDQVVIAVPAGHRVRTLHSVKPYREQAPR